MPPIRLKNALKDHFTVGVDDNDGTTMVVCTHCDAKLSYHGSTSTIHINSMRGSPATASAVTCFYMPIEAVLVLGPHMGHPQTPITG